MGEQVATEIGQAVLGHEHGGVKLGIEEDEFADQDAGKQQADHGQALGVVVGHVAVNGQFQQVGLGQHAGRGERQTHQGQEKPRPVGADVAPQPPQQGQVVGFAEFDLALGVHQNSASSCSSAC